MQIKDDIITQFNKGNVILRDGTAACKLKKEVKYMFYRYLGRVSMIFFIFSFHFSPKSQIISCACLGQMAVI